MLVLHCTYHFCNYELKRYCSVDTAVANGCVCPGEILTYECTARGGVSTVWTGSAYDGPRCEIVLLHSRFTSGQGTNVICKKGATYIVARSLSVEGNNYTSQLNVTVTPDTAGKTIECSSDNGINEILISSFVIPPTGL